MALVNEVKREINAKIVYVGPAGAGKATSLNYIYKKLKPEFRSQMKTMPVQENRMLFFDFMPPGQGNAGGYNVRFHIYTLVGENFSAASWKMLLKGADGIVFVADSTPERLDDNQECLAHILAQLEQYEQTMGSIPWLLVGNKQDSAEALSLETLQKSLPTLDGPALPSVASKGDGVLEGLFHLIKRILQGLRDKGFAAETEPEPMPDSPSVSSCQVAGQDEHGTGEPESSAAPALQISISGEPKTLADGRVGIPLLIQCGSSEKRAELTLSLTVSN